MRARPSVVSVWPLRSARTDAPDTSPRLHLGGGALGAAQISYNGEPVPFPREPAGFWGVLSRNFAPVSNREVQPGTYKNRIFKNRSMGLGQALFITLFVSHARHPDDESGRPIRRPSGPSRPPKSMIRGPSGPSRPRKSMFEAPSNNPRVC